VEQIDANSTNSILGFWLSVIQRSTKQAQSCFERKFVKKTLFKLLAYKISDATLKPQTF
jgi:hypothetical protein